MGINITSSDLKERVLQVIELLDNMSVQEFEQSLIRAGYYPKRKRPTETQKQIEQTLTYKNLDALFNRTEDGELKEEIRKSILSMRRVAELMDMMKIEI